MDPLAVFLGGLSGAIFAVQRKFAITGVLAIAIATGLGGGIIRDLLLGRIPVALTDPTYLPLVVVAAFIGFFFASLVHRGRLLLDILDPIWMGLFAVIGAQQTLNALDQSGQASSSFAAILVGFAIAIVFGLRMIALKYGIRAPEPVDVSRRLKKSVLGGRRVRRRPGMRVVPGSSLRAPRHRDHIPATPRDHTWSVPTVSCRRPPRGVSYEHLFICSEKGDDRDATRTAIRSADPPRRAGDLRQGRRGPARPL